MRVLRRPPGRDVLTCKNVRYRVRVSERRLTVGKQIQQARRAAGYKSARAFAAVLGISTTSVTRAENGWDTTGAGVYSDIEHGLSWPPGSILDYVEGRRADPPAEPAAGDTAEEQRPAFTVTEKDRARWRTMTPEEITDEGEMIGRTISPAMRIQYLRAALAARTGTLEPNEAVSKDR